MSLKEQDGPWPFRGHTDKPFDARFARFLLALPRPEAPHFMGGQGSAYGLHLAQTFRFPLVGPALRDAASALHPAL